MTPQHQTIFGGGQNGEPWGNCFATAIACILDLPVEQVPNFCDSDNWIERTNEWLKPRGYFYLDVTIQDPKNADLLLAFAGYHIISGDGPRGNRHSVVGYQGKIIHDPHPSGDGLLTRDEFGFLIPRYPRIIGRKPRVISVPETAMLNLKVK